MLITEAAHTFGLCLFVYRVLPRFDLVRACLLMCTGSVVPALFKLLLTKGHRSVFTVIVDILALLMQCSMFFIVTRYLTRDRTVLVDPVEIVQIIASMVLISLRYWENFIDRDMGILNIQAFKSTLRVGRCKTYIFASVWKIGLTLAFAYILIPDMTPMTDLFSNLRNESLFLNGSSLLRSADDVELLPTPITTNLSGSAYDNRDSFRNGNFPRFKRQAADTDSINVNNDNPNYIANYYDADATAAGAGGGLPAAQPGLTPSSPGARLPPLRQPTDFDYNDYGDAYDYNADSEGREGAKKVDKVLWRFLPLIVQAISGALCYYFARVACKLCMQGFGFSFPLMIITPTTCAIFCYLCHLEEWVRVALPNLEIGE